MRFALATCVLVVLAHAIAYLTHEYSHSFTAWALGWKVNPLALDYGPATLQNGLFLVDVSENVDYAPIFAARQGWAVAAIALAGVTLGNGVPYFVLYAASKARRVAASRLGLSAVYWLALMCAGNVWSYVPLRAITNHADIAIAAQGLGVATWALFPFLIGPALIVAWHFFVRMAPRALGTMAAGSRPIKVMAIAVTAYWFFVFFGGGEPLKGAYGLVSQLLAIASCYVLFPLSAAWLARRAQASV